MAIPPQERQADDSDGESEVSNVELPRKASFSQLLARYLRMGFLSCFGMSSGVGAEQRRTAVEEQYGALRRQMSRPLEVPQDDYASSKDEPYAQIVESFGPENSVPASFKTSFLGAGFDNEFSLTNGVKWQVWEKPGELSPEAVAHFETRSCTDTQTPPVSPKEVTPSEVIPLEVNPSLTPHTEPSPDLSPQGAQSPPEFELPLGVEWEGWGERLGEEREGVGSSQGHLESTSRDIRTFLGPDSIEGQKGGGLSARVNGTSGVSGVSEASGSGVSGDSETTGGGLSGIRETTGMGGLARSLQTKHEENEPVLDTSDGAALLSKLGAPQTIPLTPEIEEELRRSCDSSAVLHQDLSFRTPGFEAAGPHPKCVTDRLLRPKSSPSTPTREPLSTVMAPNSDNTQRGPLTAPLTGPLTTPLTAPLTAPVTRTPAPHRTKSQSASLARVKAPLRTQSLRSEGSFKIVKETHQIEEGEDDDGHKTVNQYVKLRRIGTGSYGKVVLHKDSVTGKLYAMKILHRSRLMHVHISGEETAWTDVLRETAIMKQLDHPNLVSLREVIDDPDNDKIYMVLEYEEKGPVFEGTGPEGGVGEQNARAYMRDVLAGLQYLHYQNIVHGDIKPDNLLMSAEGRIKIGDFGVSHIFENENDQLRRTPGTPAFTAPECCMGKPYHGKPADMWALGCTLYVFVTGRYPFMTQSHALEELYQALLHEAVAIPAHLHPDLQDLLQKLLEKDPAKRVTAEEAAQHPWLTADLGPLPQVHLGAIDVGAEQLQAAMTRLDDASKGRLARLFTRHAAALRSRKASAAENGLGSETGLLARTSSIKSADPYDSDFSAPSSRHGSPKRDSGAAQSPLRVGSSRFSNSERSLNLE